ncbi:MAG: hypothetical protein ACKO1N_09895 [Erythrobacter sp.]
MYRALFQNSKIALAFVGMTVLSAVSMVGTSQDKGVVTEAVDLVAAQRAQADSYAQAQTQATSGQAATGEAPVFSDYTPPDGTYPPETPVSDGTSTDPSTDPAYSGTLGTDPSSSDGSSSPVSSEPEMVTGPA